MSTGRLEKFLELPETCSVIPASCNSEEQPETEIVLQNVTAMSHNYSKVSNNLFSFLWYIYPLCAEDSITGNNIIVFYLICIHPMLINIQNMYCETFQYHIMNETVTLFSSPDAQQDSVLACNLHNRKRFKM